MISRSLFVETMDKLEALEEKINNVDKALRAFGDMNGLFIPDIYGIIVPALENQFPQSEEHWLEYFLYDTEKRHTGVIYTNNGPPIAINDWGDVYDFLISLED